MTHAAAAVLYDINGLDPDRERLTGLAVATRDFVRAYLDHGAAGPFHAHPTAPVSEAEIRARFPTDREIRVVPSGQDGALAEVGGLFIPGPVLAPFAWRRHSIGDAAYSLTGITHTMSTARALEAVRDLLTAPVRPWDAVICTSSAIRALVESCLEMQGAYLAERLAGASSPPWPMLPVIPLGVDPVRLAPAEGVREAFRRDHGLGEDDVAILYLGRLAAHAKAHPLAMFRSLGLAAARTSRRLTCVLAGWFHDAESERAFRRTAATLAPTVRLIHADARASAAKAGALAGADVFLSLVDSVQESFGITPLEAMGAGLPCVVSDWDGYRDTVVHGETGFLIPSRLPPAGSGGDIAWGRLSGVNGEAEFHAQMTEATAIDPTAAAGALIQLAEDPALRHAQGQAGIERVRTTYAWPAIIRQYEGLWAAQRERRMAEDGGSLGPSGSNPAGADPFTLFAGFASHRLDTSSTLRLAADRTAEELDAVLALPMAMIDPRLPQAARGLVAHLASKPSVTLDERSSPIVWRAAAWLIKAGFLTVDPE